MFSRVLIPHFVKSVSATQEMKSRIQDFENAFQIIKKGETRNFS